MQEVQTNARKAQRFKIDAGLRGDAGINTVIDISKGGAKLACSIELAAGSIIELSFMLPNRNQITAEIRVIWSKKAPDGAGFQSGCEFVHIAPADARLLKNYFLCLTELNKNRGNTDHCRG